MINKQSAIMMALLAFASDANGQAATLQEYVDAQEALAIGERECDSSGLATDLTDLGATAEITTASHQLPGSGHETQIQGVTQVPNRQASGMHMSGVCDVSFASEPHSHCAVGKIGVERG